MNKKIKGKVIKASIQWWIKVNTKCVRLHSLDGARFPCIITVRYEVNDIAYEKRKWVKALAYHPRVGEMVDVIYSEEKPSKARVIV